MDDVTKVNCRHFFTCSLPVKKLVDLYTLQDCLESCGAAGQEGQMSTEVCSSWMPHRSGLIAADKRGDVRFVGSRVRSKRFWSGSPKKGKMHISRAVAMPIAGLQIDRKMHLIHSWRRQQVTLKTTSLSRCQDCRFF